VPDLDQRRLGSRAGPALHLQPIAFLFTTKSSFR
jgi:hypothetical protein